jgi:hypothetical protein
MPNIKFNYLYRDVGNYKKFHTVIFANPVGIDVLILESLIKSKLIWETWFYADKWKLPEIFTDIIDFRVDPTWHEFESIEYTDELADDNFNLIEFMELIKKRKTHAIGTEPEDVA